MGGALPGLRGLHPAPDRRDAEFALGIVAVTGFSYFFNPTWALELEVAYIWDVWINTRTGFEHELATVIGGVFYF